MEAETGSAHSRRPSKAREWDYSNSPKKDETHSSLEVSTTDSGRSRGRTTKQAVTCMSESPFSLCKETDTMNQSRSGHDKIDGDEEVVEILHLAGVEIE